MRPARSTRSAKSKRRRNLFGFGGSKEVTHSTKLVRDAFAAGRRSMDDGRFESWISGEKNLSRGFKKRLRERYHAGVLSNLKEERKEKAAAAKKEKVAAKQEKRAEDRAAKTRSKTVKQDVMQRLRDEGMFSSATAGIVKRAFRKGDSPGDLYSRVLARNPEGKRRVKNRLMKMRQGDARATISTTGPLGLRKWRVQIVRPGFAVIEQTFHSYDGALAYARLKLHDVATNPGPSAADLIPGGSTIGAWAQAGQRVVKGVSSAAKTGLKKARRLVKGNPLDLAQRRYEEFTGFPSTETLEIIQRQHVHTNLVGLAQFVAFNIIGVDGKELPPLQATGMKYSGPREELYLSFKGSKPKGDWSFDERTPAGKIVWLTASEQRERDGKKVNQQLFLSGGDQKLTDTDMEYLGITARDIHDHILIGTIKRVWYWQRKTFELQGKEKVWFYHDFGEEGSAGVCPVLIYHALNPSFEIAGGRYYIDLPKKSLGGVSPGIVG
jgi:hypothetical protein